MRAVQFAETGGPEVLKLVELDEPHAGPGTIRVAVRTASVNPIDWKFRAGYVKAPLPRTPGSDVAGVVDEVGDGVTDVAVGDEVLGNATTGGYAEFAVLDAWAKKPANLGWPEAAGLVLAAETAVRAFTAVGLTTGSTLVINGASGGVGSAAVQLAVGRGVRVIGVAGRANHNFLVELGATPVEYGDGLVERIRAAAPEGVDFAFDVSGSGVIPQLIELTGDPSKVVSIADWGAGQYGAKLTGGGEGRAWEALPEAVALYEAGKYRVEVQQVFPLAEAGAAQALSQDGHVRGKLVLDVTA